MFRRSLAIHPARHLAAVAAVAAVVIGACNAAPPAAPALTDPKEILTKAVVSVKDVKTLEFTGAFTGSVSAPQLGAIDLSTVKMTAAEMKQLSPSSSVDGDFSFDVWTRKSDYRPAKLALSATTSQLGTFGISLDLDYDVSVSVDAPPADQVVTP